MNRRMAALAGAAAVALGFAVGPATPALAAPLSGAIFTTLPDGSEVNYNHYASKDLVYLDGGPGPGAPQSAAGLPDGTYVFQVTDPSGKALLSTDNVACRQFTVSAGIIAGTTGPCPHVTGTDIDHGATTVQLMPYNNTPNPGGVYKVWVERTSDYLTTCGTLAAVDCTVKGTKHGFTPSMSKTDNFKVKDTTPQEIDTRFWRGGQALDGLQVTWTDTLGASNAKTSYYSAALNVNHEAHVENVEPGTHTISIADQAGCTVTAVRLSGNAVASGPASVPVSVANTNKAFTIFLDVDCA